MQLLHRVLPAVTVTLMRKKGIVVISFSAREAADRSLVDPQL